MKKGVSVNRINKMDSNQLFSKIYLYTIAFFSILPFNSFYIIIRVIVISLFLFYLFIKKNLKIKKSLFLILIVWFINIIFSTIIYSYAEMNTNSMFHELQRWLFYSLIFSVSINCNIRFDDIVKVCKFILIFHLSIQILQKLGNLGINEWIESKYINESGSINHLSLATYKGGDFRSGSIFLNPNVYMVYPLTFLIVFLQKFILNKSNQIIWIFSSLISIYFTGSRTAIIISSIILVVFFIKNVNNKNKIIIVIFTSIVIMLLSKNYYIFDSRAFLIIEGLSDSIWIKFSEFIKYLNNASIINYFIGSLGNLNHIPIDMEIGYIFSWFGILGIIWYIAFYFELIKSNKKDFRFLITLLLCLLLLTSFTASTILNMSIFPFISVIMLSKINRC